MSSSYEAHQMKDQQREHKRRQRRRKQNAVLEERRALAHSILSCNIMSKDLQLIDGVCGGSTNACGRVDWSKVPPSLDPLRGGLLLDDNRGERKRQQEESLYFALKAVIHIMEKRGKSPSSSSLHVVDFCSGTGNSILAIAALLPHIHFTLVDIKPVCLSLALSRAQEASLTNVSIWEGDASSYESKEGFDIGIATHACGIASDLVQIKCIARRAAFLICPCCAGKAGASAAAAATAAGGKGGIGQQQETEKATALPLGLSFPRSDWMKSCLLQHQQNDHYHEEGEEKDRERSKPATEVFMMLASGADDLGHTSIPACKLLVEMDRLQASLEAGYSACITRLYPLECSSKHHVLLGIPPPPSSSSSSSSTPSLLSLLKSSSHSNTIFTTSNLATLALTGTSQGQPQPQQHHHLSCSSPSLPAKTDLPPSTQMGPCPPPSTSLPPCSYLIRNRRPCRLSALDGCPLSLCARHQPDALAKERKLCKAPRKRCNQADEDAAHADNDDASQQTSTTSTNKTRISSTENRMVNPFNAIVGLSNGSSSSSPSAIIIPPISSIFAKPSNPLLLDLGCARGKFLLDLALHHHHHHHVETQQQQQRQPFNYVGLELRSNLVDQANAKAHALGIHQHLYFLALSASASSSSDHHHGCGLQDLLQQWLSKEQEGGPVEVVTINFPDPWRRSKHIKRRLIQGPLVELLAQWLAPGAEVWLSTDVLIIAAAAKRTFDRYGAQTFFLQPAARNSHVQTEDGDKEGEEDAALAPYLLDASPFAPIVTEREAACLALSRGVYRLKWIRKA